MGGELSYEAFRRLFILWRNLDPTGEGEEGDDKVLEPLLSRGLTLHAQDMLLENMDEGSAEWPEKVRVDFPESITPLEEAFLNSLSQFIQSQAGGKASNHPE